MIQVKTYIVLQSKVLIVIDSSKPNLYLYQISIVFGQEQNTKQCEEGEVTNANDNLHLGTQY